MFFIKLPELSEKQRQVIIDNVKNSVIYDLVIDDNGFTVVCKDANFNDAAFVMEEIALIPSIFWSVERSYGE